MCLQQVLQVPCNRKQNDKYSVRDGNCYFFSWYPQFLVLSHGHHNNPYPHTYLFTSKPGETMATEQPSRHRHSCSTSCCTHMSDGCHLQGQTSSWEEHRELTAQTGRQCCIQETMLTFQLCQLTYSLNLDKLSQFQMPPFSHY